MKDTRPVCPIPDDIQECDIIIFRDGQRKQITAVGRMDKLGRRCVHVTGFLPGGVLYTGKAWDTVHTGWECVGFERLNAPPQAPPTERPRIPVPKDIDVGDTVVLRDGSQRVVEAVFDDLYINVEGRSPGGINADGTGWGHLETRDGSGGWHDDGTAPQWDLVEVIRKSAKGAAVSREYPAKDFATLCQLVETLDPSAAEYLRTTYPRSDATGLSGCMIWSCTPQGWHYWNALRVALVQGHQTRLPAPAPEHPQPPVNNPAWLQFAALSPTPYQNPDFEERIEACLDDLHRVIEADALLAELARYPAVMPSDLHARITTYLAQKKGGQHA